MQRGKVGAKESEGQIQAAFWEGEGSEQERERERVDDRKRKNDRGCKGSRPHSRATSMLYCMREGLLVKLQSRYQSMAIVW